MSQAFQSLGSTISGWGAPSIGGVISNIPYDVSNIGSNIAGWFSPTAAAAGPSDAAGGGMAAPAPALTSAAGPSGPETPEQVMGAPGTATTASGAPYSSASAPAAVAAGAGQPEQSWWRQAIESLTGKKVGEGGGGAALTMAGNLGDAVQRYMIMRRLQDPSQVLKQSQVLSRGLSKGLKRGVAATVGQEMAQAGLAGAPNLYAQAVTSALAPYRFQEQQNALQQYLEAMRLSEGAYPGEGGMYGPYGGYGRYPGEEEAQKQASPAG